MRTVTLTASALVALAACAYRPGRFADAPPVGAEGDDGPVPVPEAHDTGTAELVSEAWLRGPLADALDPRRTPDAGDVNAYDDVARSTWFHPTPDDDDRDGVARAPLAVAEAGDGRLSIVDARGLAYALTPDPPGNAELRSATAAVTSRLVRALGWRTPEAHVAMVSASDFVHPDDARVAAFLGQDAARERPRRVLATRWPIGRDLGATAPMGTRRDDPNDRIPHEDRRSLRALGVVAAWLAFDDLGPRSVRDAYVGEPGRGHVEHFVVSAERSLGASRAVAEAATETDAPDDALRNLITLGVVDATVRARATALLPGLGDLDGHVGRERVSIPWAPHARATPADRYWAAKRMAVLPPATIARAVGAAALSEPRSGAQLAEVLEARRRATVAEAFSTVTPAELDGLERDALVLRDAGRAAGIASVPRWRVALLDGLGRPIALEVDVPGDDVSFRVPLAAAGGHAYVVVRVTAAGNGSARRPMEAHLRAAGDGFHVVGLRH